MWINCGPLEYDGTSGGHSSQQTRLCGDELLLIIERAGFELLETRMIRCNYTSDAASMLQAAFQSIYFVARKL